MTNYPLEKPTLPPGAPPPSHPKGPTWPSFGKDFLTGCLALAAVILILFVIVPALIIVFKLSAVLVIPIGIVAALVVLTAFLGRIINLLRRRGGPGRRIDPPV